MLLQTLHAHPLLPTAAAGAHEGTELCGLFTALEQPLLAAAGRSAPGEMSFALGQHSGSGPQGQRERAHPP